MIEESAYDFSATNHTFLHQTSGLDDPIEFIDYVINKGADVDAKSPSGQTALHNSILAEREDITEKLLACGADINAQTHDGKTILFLLVDRFWHNDSVHNEDSTWYEAKLQALINNCISRGADLTFKDAQGDTALSYAASKKQTEAYQLEVLKLLTV